MPLTNQQRVGKALDFLREGLADFIHREFQNKYGAKATGEAQRAIAACLRDD